MSDTQDKTIHMLTRAATSNGLELINDKQWGNTGILRVERKDSLTPLVSIEYSFQDKYASFTVVPDFGMGQRHDGKLSYVTPEDMMGRVVNPLIYVIARLAGFTKYPNEGFARGVSDTLNANLTGREYVVDVFIPVSISVRADDEHQAASIAVERAVEQKVIERIGQMVDSDDSDFTISDSDVQTEVGEA